MNQGEYFRGVSSFLVQTHEYGCLYFTSDREKYNFVQDRGLNLQGVKEGEKLVPGGHVQKCIQDAQVVVGTYPSSVYGVRVKVFVHPVVENGEVTGTFGVMTEKSHPIDRSFNLMAETLANSYPEGAFVLMTDREKITRRQPSEKFDIKAFQEGMAIKEGGVAYETIRSKKLNIRYIGAEVYGTPCTGINLPLFDPDDKEVVGTFGIYLSRDLAEKLQGISSKLSANIQEIASVMEEVAASASEISTNEGNLSEKVNEVARISVEINEVLDFIKNVADQTKMLGLNAAIEAARAGEHGRGFGVVAEEIRKLSDQSKETADRIRKLTQEIEAKIKIISTASDGTLKQSQEQAAATEEVTASAMEMAQVAEELNEAAKSL